MLVKGATGVSTDAPLSVCSVTLYGSAIRHARLHCWPFFLTCKGYKQEARFTRSCKCGMKKVFQLRFSCGHEVFKECLQCCARPLPKQVQVHCICQNDSVIKWKLLGGPDFAFFLADGFMMLQLGTWPQLRDSKYCRVRVKMVQGRWWSEVICGIPTSRWFWILAYQHPGEFQNLGESWGMRWWW